MRIYVHIIYIANASKLYEEVNLKISHIRDQRDSTEGLVLVLYMVNPVSVPEQSQEQALNLVGRRKAIKTSHLICILKHAIKLKIHIINFLA